MYVSTPTTSRNAIPKPKCIKCDQIIPLVKESFTSGLCHKKIHITCVDGIYTDAEAENTNLSRIIMTSKYLIIKGK